jgi:ParB-like chromosome segregation protein Spo0J
MTMAGKKTAPRADVEKLTVQEIGVEKLTPNPWNPNRMSEEMREKLKAYLEREGFVEPLVVRRKGKGHEILGGFHRWGIAKDLGYKTVPCVVVELDDRRAKILSVNLNEMKGQTVQNLMADLVHTLSKELTLADLETQLPYSADELKDSLELLKIPDGLDTYLDEEAERQESQRPTVFSFVVEGKDADVVEQAIDAAKQTHGTTKGRALVELCKAYLTDHDGCTKR